MGVPPEDIPDGLTRFTGGYLGDLYHLAEIDAAERKRIEDEAEKNRR